MVNWALLRNRFVSFAGAFAATLATMSCGGGVAPNQGAKQSGTLAFNSSSLDFGKVTVGTSKNMSLTLLNSSPAGSSSITITDVLASGQGFKVAPPSVPVTLAPGQSTSATVTFDPKSTGSSQGAISITVLGDATPANVTLSGQGVTAGSLSPSPSSLNFGSVTVGAKSSLSLSLTNNGGTAVDISQASSSNGSFTLSGISLPVSVSPNQSVSMTVSFTPSSAVSVSGNLTLTSDASNSPTTVALSGTGVATPGTLSANPTSLAFGNVVVGANSSLQGSLKATVAAVTVTSLSGMNAEFTVSGLKLPASISAGQGVSFTVTFTPQASGTASTTLTFVSNASNSPAQLSVSGNGTAAPQHSVDLSWNASTSQGVVGYNVYRSTTHGSGYAQINGSLNATTTYTDNQVSAGVTYYYVATAVDGSGLESGYSNEVIVTIPTP